MFTQQAVYTEIKKLTGVDPKFLEQSTRTLWKTVGTSAQFQPEEANNNTLAGYMSPPEFETLVVDSVGVHAVYKASQGTFKYDLAYHVTFDGGVTTLRLVNGLFVKQFTTNLANLKAQGIIAKVAAEIGNSPSDTDVVLYMATGVSTYHTDIPQYNPLDYTVQITITEPRESVVGCEVTLKRKSDGAVVPYDDFYAEIFGLQAPDGVTANSNNAKAGTNEFTHESYFEMSTDFRIRDCYHIMTPKISINAMCKLNEDDGDGVTVKLKKTFDLTGKVPVPNYFG